MYLFYLPNQAPPHTSFSHRKTEANPKYVRMSYEISLENYTGRLIILVSCVKDPRVAGIKGERILTVNPLISFGF